MKFINLEAQYKRIEKNISGRISKVFSHGQYILGPEVSEIEKVLADYVGVDHCVTVSSGTCALLLSMMALGVNEGDEVLVPNFTFVAPAEMTALLKAKPVFVDIDENTYNINSALLEKAVTSKTKAIIPVCLYGQCANFDEINRIARKHNIPVIEDAAQSFGATYKGKRSCSLSTIGCTSFFPPKPLGCYGEGGACFTNDDELAEKIRILRHQGQKDKYLHSSIGVNGRFDTIQAAVLLAKMEIFDEELELRQKAAENYSNLLREYVKVPYIELGNKSAYAQYTISHPKRDKIVSFLRENEIPTAIHYPTTLHFQPCFSEVVNKNAVYEISQKASREVVSLPFDPYISSSDIERISKLVIEAVSQRFLS